MTTGRQDAAASIFVTVGSTKFTLLIRAILSPPVLDAISKAAKETGKAASIIIQFGATPIHEVLFDEKDGLQAIDGQATGTLPIKLLGGSQSPNDAPPDAKELAQNLSPEAIREQVTGQKQSALEPAMGLKHFALYWKASHGAVNIELIDYVPSIGPYLQSADIVISHAGSGTILEALRMDKATRPRLVIVPNETLMDNHQTELARALGERRYVYAVRLPSKGAQAAERAGQLPDLLHALICQSQEDTLLQDFPDFVPGRFRAIVDEEMGFS